MTTTEQMAQVLEDAAQLYEAEKVEWCAGSWGDGEKDGVGPLSVCASTALGMAAGLGWVMPAVLAEYRVTPCTDRERLAEDVGFATYQLGPESLTWSRASDELYRKTRQLVDKRQGEELPEFNDQEDWDDAGLILTPRRTKQEIIDLFKDTAKELRNGNQD
jgi:hypothetical protein